MLKILQKESLYTQFDVTKKRTNMSHVMEYGDLTLGKNHMVSEFQGENGNASQKIVNLFRKHVNALLKKDAVATVDVRESIIKKRLAAAEENSVEQADLQRELTETLQQKTTIFSTIQSIAQRSFQINGDLEKVLTKHTKLTQHDCYISATQRIHDKCFDIQNEYALHKLFVIANLCELGIQDFTINNAVDAVCGEVGRQNFQY